MTTTGFVIKCRRTLGTGFTLTVLGKALAPEEQRIQTRDDLAVLMKCICFGYDTRESFSLHLNV